MLAISSNPIMIKLQVKCVTKMNPHIRPALSSFAELVRGTYGDEVVRLVLFGSQARGEATEHSDIDVGVILKTITDRRVVRDRLGELAYDVLLESGEDIQAIAISAGQWEFPETSSNPSLPGDEAGWRHH